MDEKVRGIEWEAPAHHHFERGGDWFWALGIITLSGAAAAFFFENYLLTVLIVVAGLIAALMASREPDIVTYAVTIRGLRIDDDLHPYSTLDAFYIDEDDPKGPQLLARSKRMWAHLIVMPLPPEELDAIEDILETRLPEEHMEEPLASKVLEILGF